MARPDKPSIIIVHGAWHLPTSYQDLVDGLRSSGYHVTCPALPSCSRQALDRSEDVSVVRQEIQAELAKDKDIVVLAHSYGGIVASEAVQEQHSLGSRQAQNLAGGVRKMIYLVSLLVPPGHAVLEVLSDNTGVDIQLQVDEDGIATRVLNPREAFCNDVLSPEKIDAAVAVLVDHTTSAAWTPIHKDVSPGWLHVPCVYIFCELDNAVSLQCQRRMFEWCKENGAKFVNEVTLKTGHSPWLSQKDECLAVVEANL